MTGISFPPGYRERRALNWILAGSMYAFFYMARYNLEAASALLADLYGWTNTQLGVISSTATLIYGLSVFLNGPLADRIGGRRALLIGAAGAAVFNCVFGLGSLLLASPARWAGVGAARHVELAAELRFGMTGTTMLAMFAAVWACNHYFQSFGALSIVKINAAWFQLRERGVFAGIFGILIRIGLILAFYGAPVVVTFLPWQWVFFVPALCIALLFVLNFLFVRNTPRDAGYDYDTDEAAPEEQSGPSTLGVVMRKVFASRTMWTLASASMMIGFVRRSVVDQWWPKYFANVHHADPKHLTAFPPYLVAAWGIAVAGILGGICFGLLSDRIFGGRRAPVVTLAFCGQALVLCVFGLCERAAAGAMVSAGAIVALSFFVNGAHGLVGGAASMDFGGKRAAATATGLFDGMQYIAGSLVGIGMGRLLDRYGWGVWPFAPIPFAILGAVLMSRLWNVLPAGRRVEPAKIAAAR